MATRTKKTEGAPAPKRPRRAAKPGESAVPELSTPLASAEAADMGLTTDGVVGGPATSVDDSRVAQRAYELYEEGGWESGRDLQHWLQAEAELRGRIRR